MISYKSQSCQSDPVNPLDVRATVERLASSGVRLHCLAFCGADLTSPTGKMKMDVVTVDGEFERDLLIERTQSGLARAKSQGKSIRRPRSLGTDQINLVEKRIAKGETIAALAREFGTSRQSIMRIR